jgi:hypothetical protein
MGTIELDGNKKKDEEVDVRVITRGRVKTRMDFQHD